MPPSSSYQGKSLGHGKLGREEVVEMMVTRLGDDPTKAASEVVDTRGSHVSLYFRKRFIKISCSGLRI